MSYLSVSQTDRFVEKYFITDYALQNIIQKCTQILQQHYLISLIPIISFYEANTLIQELLNSIFKPQPISDNFYDENEPINTQKDNYQSAIRIEFLPQIQEEFITSITKFRNSSLKSSMKSSVQSKRLISAQKMERSQQTVYGQTFKQISPIPIICDDETDDEQDRFYRGVYEMKKKQQEQIRQNKIIAEKQKISLHQKLTDLKKKYKNCIVTYDHDGTIIIPKIKQCEIKLQVQPETRVHHNIKNKNLDRYQTQITNIINSSIQRQQKLTHTTSIKTEVSMQTEPIRVNSSFGNFDNYDITSKRALKVMLQDKNLKLTKKEFQSLVSCENNIGDVLSQKLQRMTQIQLQRISYIEQQNLSKSMTPLRQEQGRNSELSEKTSSLQRKPEQGKININLSNKLAYLDNSLLPKQQNIDFLSQTKMQTFSRFEQTRNQDLPQLQSNNNKNLQLKNQKQNETHYVQKKIRSITSQA